MHRPFAFYTPLRPLQIPEPQKQFLNRLFAWVHVAHRGLNVIVSRYVLQRERIGVPPASVQRVPQRMQARVRVGLDPFAQLRHLLFEHPGPFQHHGSTMH